MLKLDGIMTALVTPLNSDGTVDEQTLTALIDYQIAHKVHSLLLLGGTGEYTSMTMEERFRAVDITVKAVNKRVPLVVGVLETGVGECLKFCKYCKNAGADAMLVLTPFYIMGTQDALAEFYKTLDREVDMPIPVSYTHLDVYKRQAQCQPVQHHLRDGPTGRLQIPAIGGQDVRCAALQGPGHLQQRPVLPLRIRQSHGSLGAPGLLQQFYCCH